MATRSPKSLPEPFFPETKKARACMGFFMSELRIH